MSQNPFKLSGLKILEVLKEAHQRIEAINIHPDGEMLKTKALTDIKKNITSLSINLEVPLPEVEEQSPAVVGAPLTKLFGKILNFDAAAAQKEAAVDNSEKISATEQVQKAKELYHRFLLLTTEEVLNSLSVQDIYAVADMAGVEYEEVPEVADAEFVEKLRGAIKDKAAPAAPNETKTLTADEVAVEELKNKRDALYTVFVDTENDKLLDMPEIEIRAVAKKAGLPVTENSPKKVDVKFVTQIKDAIKKQTALDAGSAK